MIWTNHSQNKYKSTTNLFENKVEVTKTAPNLDLPVQKYLYQLRVFLHRHPFSTFFLISILLVLCCFGLKSATIHSKVDQLWLKGGDKLIANDLTKYEDELDEQISYTHQLVIQTSKDPSAHLVHPDSLLTHLEVIKAASSVTVNVFNTSWKLKDICYTPSFTNFEVPYVDQIFRHIVPCSIITPLDCFWEGSKLLGPDSPATIPRLPYKLKWTSLNPEYLLQVAKSFGTNFPIRRLEDIMKKAGITTGYQKKPCLNPSDKECPSTAPNKNSPHKLNIGKALSGGCQGYASKYMQWPESLILGGIKKNATGQITSVEALQTVIQLMGEKELFEYYKDDYKVHQIHWSPQKASHVLQLWQRKFTEEIDRQVNMLEKASSQIPYTVYTFSTVQLNDLLNHFSKVNLANISYAYLTMMIFLIVVLFIWRISLISQIILGVFSVILTGLTTAAALGFCAVIGLPFNALTIHILPYLGLSLGIWNLLSYFRIAKWKNPNVLFTYETSTIQFEEKRFSILIISVINIGIALSAAVIPIPALRIFCIQVVVLLTFNLVASLFIFQNIIDYSLRKKSSNIFHWFTSIKDEAWSCLENQNMQRKFNELKKKQAVTRALPPDQKLTETTLEFSSLDENPPLLERIIRNNSYSSSSNLKSSILTLCSQFLIKKSTRTLAVILVCFSLIIASWRIGKLHEGLELSDIVPQKSKEHSFLLAQEKYFGFYNMFVMIGEEFDYANNQNLLYQFHNAFLEIPTVVKINNKESPFWLSMFRDWLIGLQKSFDRDWSQGCITREHWFYNASEEGILAYKLMVQTGDLEKPVDKGQITSMRLVDKDGIINPNAFYNYLSAWVCNDALAYSASLANLKPEPVLWCFSSSDYQLEIPKSSPLVQAQIPFNLQGLTSFSHITSLITQIQELCNKFKEKGLPNFAFGIPFIFWEHYQQLKQKVCLAISCVLTCILIVVFMCLKNIKAAFITMFTAAFMIVQNLSLFSLLGVKFNALTSVLLILSIGLDMQHILPTCISLITVSGDQKQKMESTLKRIIPLTFFGFITCTLSFALLLMGNLSTVMWNFLKILMAINAIGYFNGLLLLPIFLVFMEPSKKCHLKNGHGKAFISPLEVSRSDDDERLFIPSTSVRNQDLKIVIDKRVAIQVELDLETTIQCKSHVCVLLL